MIQCISFQRIKSRLLTYNTVQLRLKQNKTTASLLLTQASIIFKDTHTHNHTHTHTHTQRARFPPPPSVITLGSLG